MLVYDLSIWIFIVHCGLLSLPFVSSVAGIPQQTDGDPWPGRAVFCQVHPIQCREGKSHPVKAVLLEITLGIFCPFLQAVR